MEQVRSEQNPNPIMISVPEQRPFVDMVDSILSAKADNPSADTCDDLKHEIDCLIVYDLYAVTPLREIVLTVESIREVPIVQQVEIRCVLGLGQAFPTIIEVNDIDSL